MPDLSFKCIWWVLVLLLTGYFSIDAGMYLLYMKTLTSFVMHAVLWPCALCSSSDSEDYLPNGTFLDTNEVLNHSLVPLKDKTWSSEGKMALSRRKRDLLFPSGVKLCSHETVQQAIQNHLNYFHLRGKNQTFRLFLRDSGIVAKNGNCKVQYIADDFYSVNGCSLRSLCEKNELMLLYFSSIIIN